jgi:hypothetical protein
MLLGWMPTIQPQRPPPLLHQSEGRDYTREDQSVHLDRTGYRFPLAIYNENAVLDAKDSTPWRLCRREYNARESRYRFSHRTPR